jgi:hypothetical protein
MKRLFSMWAVPLVLVALMPGLAAAQGNDDRAATKKAARELAAKIDKIIEARLAKEKIKPAPEAGESLFLRRLHLDLAGRIPSLLDIRDYLDDDRPEKKEIRVDHLLDGSVTVGQQPGEAYSRHWAALWRALMLQGTNNQQAQFQQFGFETWIRNKLQNNIGYDKLVFELVTQSPFDGRGGQGGAGGSPQAFYFANENKVENLAGATARMFLGVKIECAQCHAHPFASWKKEQFWEYAAFFSGIPNQQVDGGRRPRQFNANSREIQIPNTDKTVKAKFLDGAEPQWKDNTPTLRVLGEWMTSPKNPYFAKAAVDHIWSYFMGVSLFEPIVEPSTDDPPPTHPELLDLLAKEFVAQNFDVKFVIRAIAQTKAYARLGGSINKHKQEIEMFARMPVRGMTPEQLFDSLCEATDYQDPYANNPQMAQQQFNGGPMTPRALFLSKFTSQDKRTETQTSILQALFMMNGKFLAERTKLENNKSLQTIATAPTSNERRIETMYLMVLSRLPREDEVRRLARYIETGGPSRDPRQAVADVYWALLNSGEFLLNH